METNNLIPETIYPKRFKHWNISNLKGRDNAVGIATGYELDDQGVGVRVPVGARIFTFPYRPDRLWGPHSLLSNG
jgi:hypothetical protein